MAADSLDELVRSADSVVGLLRSNAETFSLGDHFPAVPNEVTHWLAEQQAIIETCALGDLSHHMTTVRLDGPDTREFLSRLCVNDLASLSVGEAKHLVFCGPSGHLIGDGPLLRLAEEAFWTVPYAAENWLAYQLERTDLDVTARFDPPTATSDDDPETFIYQVQGPNAFDVLEGLTDADLESIGFYRFEEVTLAGREVRAFGHGMSTEPGLELHGSWSDAEAVATSIMDAGAAHGIRRLGSRAYNSQSVRLGWIGAGPPPIYDVPALREFREWLGTDTREATFSIEGSYASDDICDYYMDPIEYGFAPLIDLDHDFVGREALERRVDDPDRAFVTLHWDDAAMVDVYASLFADGPGRKHFDLPRPRYGTAAFDTVLKDGNPVGISRRRSYQPDVRGIVSLAVVDVEHRDPGTEVAVVWGEGPDSSNPRLEAHEPTEIPATVRPVPYATDHRKSSAER